MAFVLSAFSDEIGADLELQIKSLGGYVESLYEHGEAGSRRLSLYMRVPSAHLDDFQRACEKRARELGFAGEITAETGVFSFPDRIYGGVKVPAGEYRALRITIGSGEGHNWWCVLYPKLCVMDEVDYAGGEPVYYSKILRWIGDKIGGLK